MGRAKASLLCSLVGTALLAGCGRGTAGGAEPARARNVLLVECEKQGGARGLEQRDEPDRSKTYDERIGGEEHERAPLSAL